MMKEEKLKKKEENKRLIEERRVQKEIKKKENIEKQKQIEEAARKRKLVIYIFIYIFTWSFFHYLQNKLFLFIVYNNNLIYQAEKGFGESITKKKKRTNQNNVLNTSNTAYPSKSLPCTNEPISVRSESRTKHIKPIHKKSPNKYQESPFKNSEPLFGKPLPDNTIEHDALTLKVNKSVEDIEFDKNYQELLQVEEELNKIHERKKLVIEVKIILSLILFCNSTPVN